MVARPDVGHRRSSAHEPRCACRPDPRRARGFDRVSAGLLDRPSDPGGRPARLPDGARQTVRDRDPARRDPGGRRGLLPALMECAGRPAERSWCTALRLRGDPGVPAGGRARSAVPQLHQDRAVLAGRGRDDADSGRDRDPADRAAGAAAPIRRDRDPADDDRPRDRLLPDGSDDPGRIAGRRHDPRAPSCSASIEGSRPSSRSISRSRPCWVRPCSISGRPARR